MVSVVIPFYNESGNVRPVIQELADVLKEETYELVLVDDCSSDGTLNELIEVSEDLPGIRVIRMERNSGQSAALLAGFLASRAPLVASMDGDGQNDPADLIPMLEGMRRDADLACVTGLRRNRHDSAWRRFQSRVANAARNLITDDHIVDTGCSLRVARREYLLGLPRFNGVHRFIPTLVGAQGGGQVVEVEVNHRARIGGYSKYGMLNRVFWALRDALGVRWLKKRRVSLDSREVAR